MAPASHAVGAVALRCARQAGWTNALAILRLQRAADILISRPDAARTFHLSSARCDSGAMHRALKQGKQNRRAAEMRAQQLRTRLQAMEMTRDPLPDPADGSKVIVRAIRFEDGPRLQAFVRSLSARSRRLRFFSSLNELSAAQLDRFTHLDPNRGLALVAVSAREPDVIIAEARCVLDGDGVSAEFALVVTDQFQRRTLGRQLVKRLLAYASARGVRRLFGEIMADNHATLAFARRLGFDVFSNPSDATTLIAQRIRGATS